MTTTGSIHKRRHFARRVLATFALIGVVGTAAGSPASADDVPLTDRQFTVSLKEIRSLDETGPFNSGLSDEIYAGFLTTYPGGRYHVQTGMFGDFDAGEKRTARSDQSCLMPIQAVVNNGNPDLLSGFERDTWSCTPHGFNAPFSLRAVLWESDVEIPFCDIPCEFNPIGGGPPSLGSRAGDDDKVGETVLSFSQTGLALDFPTAGASRDYSIEHFGSGGHYRVTYRVTRVS